MYSLSSMSTKESLHCQFIKILYLEHLVNSLKYQFKIFRELLRGGGNWMLDYDFGRDGKIKSIIYIQFIKLVYFQYIGSSLGVWVDIFKLFRRSEGKEQRYFWFGVGGGRAEKFVSMIHLAVFAAVRCKTKLTNIPNINQQ